MIKERGSVAGFDAVLGVDWSGAKGRLPGLQIAECRPGRSAPVLLTGPRAGGGWRRLDVLDLIIARIVDAERLLVGFDFAFAYAHADAGAYYPDRSGGPRDAPALWRFVDDLAGAAEDLYGGVVYGEGSPVREHYRAPGFRGARYRHRRRETERVCAEAWTAPHPVFKCIGAANVGTGSLAGMRFLHHLRERLGPQVAVWPFDPPDAATSIVCEIFPRLYFKRAGLDPRAWRQRLTVDDALTAYGSARYRGAPLDTEDKADAVVAAAALRHLAGEAAVWAAPSRRPESKLEGWIFGVE